MEIFKYLKNIKNKINEKTDDNNFVFNAKNQYNARISKLFEEYRFLQICVIISLLISIISLMGIIYIGSKSKFIPYIVEVNKLGESIVVNKVDEGTIKDSRIIRAKIASFIKSLRTITNDVKIQRQFIYDSYHALNRGDPAINKTNDYYKNTNSNPFELGKQITREVEIISLLEQSSNTYQIDWNEKTYSHDGVLLYIKGYRALIKVYVINTAVDSVEQLLKNPLGIFIEDYSITELSSSKNNILVDEKISSDEKTGE